MKTQTDLTFRQAKETIADMKGEQKNQGYWSKFRGKSFIEFNDMIGLPIKDGKEYPIFDYELEIFPAYQLQKQVWIKKSTGLGITEFTLRWIAWRCVRDDRWKGHNVIVITGPNIELSQKLIDRFKRLFKDYIFDSHNRLAVVNGVYVEAFPSHHLDAARGLNPKCIFLDEADFFNPNEQDEARSVAERYLAKNQATIIMVSTPNNPGGLFDRMEHEENSYKKILLPWKKGLGRIFTTQDIELAKTSPSFEREYNLQYGVGSGNIFQGVDDIIEKYDLKLSHGQKVFICDPAYGSSKFGTLGLEKIENVIYVKDATEYDRPSPSAMLDIITLKAKNYGNTCLVDSAHPGLIRDLRDKGVNALDVKFGQQTENKLSLLSLMTIEAAQAVKERRIRIHPDFRELIAQLKAVKFNDKGHPDKKELTFDLGDCVLMGCNYLKSANVIIKKVNQKALEEDE